MGSRYLKRLSLEYKGFPPAVYGAYNAGEPAVDIWLKRRAHSDPLTFVELVPFGETKSYIRNVWRNVMVYSFLGAGHGSPIAMPRIEITPKDKNPMEMSNNPGNIIPVRTYAE
jgi:soluble lytic murein transglycosylase-like protein